MTEPANKLTPAMNLYHHGTEKWSLSPNVVYQTALQDLRSKNFNDRLAGDRRECQEKGEFTEQCLKALPPRRHYGFAGKHVRKANNAAELLKLALEDREAGTMSGNVNTLALYDNTGVLAKAYTLACATA